MKQLNKNLHRPIVIGLVLAPVLFVHPASAQDSANENQLGSNSRVLEEIIVTAQFRKQNLQDTPLAITAFSGEMIEERSARNLADIANAAPSVVIRPQTGFWGPSIHASIRGFGQGDYNPAYEPGVGLYIDDVYYPRLTGANFDLLDLERVEVLRGPQGTLTGRNSEGGAIRFVTRKPTGENGGHVAATYGSRDRINLMGSVDFGLTDNLSGRLSGTYADQDGFIDVLNYDCVEAGGGDCKEYAQGDTGYKAVRGILRYRPTETLDVMIGAGYNRDRRYNGGQVLLYADNSQVNVLSANGVPLDMRFVCGKHCNYYTNGHEAAIWSSPDPFFDGIPQEATLGPLKSDFESYNTHINIEYQLTDALKLTSISAYQTFDSQYSSDGDLAPTNTEYGFDDLDNEFWSQELRLNAEFSDRLQAVFGGYYSKEDTIYHTQQDLRTIEDDPLNPLFPVQTIFNDTVKTSSAAVFTTLTFTATDAITLTAGLRYTRDEKSYHYNRFNYDGVTINPFLDLAGALYGAGYVGPDPFDTNFNGETTDTVSALTGRTSTFKDSRVDYRVSVDYRFNEAVLAYATVATGYKAGGVSPRALNGDQAVAFGPEELTMYELGVKTDLFENRLRVNGAVFYNDFSGAQLALSSCEQFGGGPCAVTQNAGDAIVTGGEIEIFAKPVDGLQIDLSASYLDWEWDCVNPRYVGDFPGTDCSNDTFFLSQLNDVPPSFSDTTVNAGIQYAMSLGEKGSLTSRLDAAYLSGSSTNEFRVPAGSPSARYGDIAGYTVFNGRITWRNVSEDLSIALAVTNLFDKYYFVTKFDDTGATSAITGQPGRPREWAITLKKQF